MHLAEFQRLIEAIYGAKDRARGPERSFLWLVEEVGELSEEVRRAVEAGHPAGQDAGHASEALGHDHHARLEHEVGDVLAWLTTLASMLDVDLERAAARYAAGCPRCGATPCACAGA